MIRGQFDSSRTNDTQQKTIIDNVLQELQRSPNHVAQADTKNKSIFDRILGAVFGGSKSKDSLKIDEPTDLEFLSSLNLLVATYPALFGLSQQVIGSLREDLFYRENEFVNQNLGKAVDSELRARITPLKEDLQHAFGSHIDDLRAQLSSDLLAAMGTTQT